MDFSWLPPLIAGTVLSLVASIVTGIAQARREKQRAAASREEVLQDRRFERGREAAVRALDDLVALKRDTVDAGAPGKLPGDHYKFDRALLGSLKRNADLITRRSVREPVGLVARMMRALGPAEHEFSEPRWKVERALLAHSEAILTAYLRGDQTPAASADFIVKTHVLVDEAWKAADDRGEVYKE